MNGTNLIITGRPSLVSMHNILIQTRYLYDLDKVFQGKMVGGLLYKVRMRLLSSLRSILREATHR